MGAHVQVENDVNLMALAEHRHYWPTVNHFLYIKAGTGIGSSRRLPEGIRTSDLRSAGTRALELMEGIPTRRDF
jgi:hypothetical protein